MGSVGGLIWPFKPPAGTAAVRKGVVSVQTYGLRRVMILPSRLFRQFRGRKAQLALAVRVTVAAVAAFAIASALHLMLPLWAVLTSLIVTQLSVGRSLKVSRDYLFGTIGGALYGGTIAVLVPHAGEIELLALLALAVAPLAFLAAVKPSLNPAVVTAVIVLLLPELRHAPALSSAIDRVLEVGVGAECVITSETRIQGFLQPGQRLVLVAHRVAAIFDDDDRIVVAQHMRQGLHQDRGLLLRLCLRARIFFVHRLSPPGHPVRVLAARCDKLNARKRPP